MERACRERGLRLTPQRQLILEAVHELGHATPEQVCAQVQREAPAVNITTVYRSLDLLERLGLVWFSREPLPDPTAYQVLEAQPDVLFVLAGDGTAGSIASRAGPDGPLVAPLPGGTMNIHDSEHAHQLRLAAGMHRVSRRSFLISAAFGLATAADLTVTRAIQEQRELPQILTLPDDLAVFPTHGAGSFCSAPAGADALEALKTLAQLDADRPRPDRPGPQGLPDGAHLPRGAAAR